MKILEFIDGFNFENFGGAGRVFIEVAKVLSAQGHQIDVICRNDQTGNYENPYGIRFHHYNCRNSWFLPKYFHRKQSIRNLTKTYLGENKPDLIIIHSSSAIFGITSLLEKVPAKKLYYFHSPWCEEHRINESGTFPFNLIMHELRKRRELEALKLCDGIITLSRYMQNLMLKIHPGIKGKNMTVIPGGADPDKFFPVANKEEKLAEREKFGIAEGSFVLMTSRRLIPRTGVDVLIRAFALVKSKAVKDMKLLIVGTGILLDELKSLSASLGLEKNVIFTGFVPESKLPSCYRAADLFIMPTRELEGFGLSTVEAMACGIPAIGTDIGGTPEILREIQCNTGILPVSEDLIIKGCNEEAVSEKIFKFSFLKTLSELGNKSLESARSTFNWKKHVEKMNEFIHNMKQENNG